MNLKRISSLVLRIALQFRRDRRTLAMIVVAPIVILSLLSYLVNLNTSPMTVGVVLEDTSSVGLRLAEEMNDVPMFVVTEITSEDIDDLIRNGSIEAAVIIPENNAQHLTEQTVSGMKIIVNGSRSRTESTVAQGINFAINKVLMDAMGIPLQRPEVTFVYAGSEYEVIDYFAPTFHHRVSTTKPAGQLLVNEKVLQLYRSSQTEGSDSITLPPIADLQAISSHRGKL